MNAITSHLDDLLTELQIAADLRSANETATTMRKQLATRLDAVHPMLAARVRYMDDWHAEVLADFIADAHIVADALEHVPPRDGPAADETRVG
jgi:hypothetical protein